MKRHAQYMTHTKLAAIQTARNVRCIVFAKLKDDTRDYFCPISRCSNRCFSLVSA